MTDLPGPISISALQAPISRELGLRLFQRVTAQVLTVTGSTATLSIEGHPVVAQLTSAEQANLLLSQNKAQFIVTQLTGEGITLKLVSSPPPQAAAPGAETAALNLALASRQAAQTGQAFGQLIASLQAAGQNLSPELVKQIDENVQRLEELILNWDENPAELAQPLSKAVSVLGKSLENALVDKPEKSLLSLAQLEQKMEQAGEKELARSINNFLGDLRQQHLIHTRTDSGHEAWSQIGLALRNTDGKLSTARLRIAREHGPGAEKANPPFTRLVLQVDLEPGKTVEMALSLSGEQIRSKLTAPDPHWCEQAQNELPSLEEALQQLGFHLKDTQIAVGEPRSFELLPGLPGNPLLARVDIEA